MMFETGMGQLDCDSIKGYVSENIHNPVTGKDAFPATTSDYVPDTDCQVCNGLEHWTSSSLQQHFVES